MEQGEEYFGQRSGKYSAHSHLCESRCGGPYLYLYIFIRLLIDGQVISGMICTEKLVETSEKCPTFHCVTLSTV